MRSPRIATVRERIVERGRQPRGPTGTQGAPTTPQGENTGLPLVRRVTNSATVMRRSHTQYDRSPHPMTVRTQTTAAVDLVKVAYAQNETEAEFLQGLLRDADVGSVVRRAPGFDVPDVLAAGPRHVLVARSDVPVAQEVLREVEPIEGRPAGAVRRRPAVAGARRTA